MRFIKSNTGFARFGQGLYFSSRSSKSHGYNGKSEKVAGRRLMLLCHVAAGCTIKYTQDQTHLTEPPAGYDSVVGEPTAGGALNYDELIVYNEDACCPTYLVVYRFQ